MPQPVNAPLCHLPVTEKRKCDIKVWSDRIVFSGKFLYLRQQEFYSNKGLSDTALPRNFLGMGYLSQRSYRKTLLFIISGVLMEGAKLLLDKLSELLDNANRFLQWIGQAITLPDWMNTTVNLLAVICLALGVILFFSKHKVVEISFTDKRICIPQKSITHAEYTELYHTIKELKQRN